MADVASDVTELVDHLGVGRFVTVGWWGGGPHALACARLAPRCATVATIAGVAPYGSKGWTGPQAWAGARRGVRVSHRRRARVAGQDGEEMVGLAPLQPEQVVDALVGLISAPDRRCLAEGFDDFIAAWIRLAVSTGADGYWDDNVAIIVDWGFDLDAINVPVTACRADLDLMVPPTHGEWLAANVPGATGILKKGEGHISLVHRYVGDIIGCLASAPGPL